MSTPTEIDNVDLDSPVEDPEASIPCKGCGEVLEEGKAFELAGNRWHIDCFRCNTCATLLDSDANLLLLGDGSLICNNCTYSCNACGNKIEDLAILTGDEAFCATCFKCRNCKRKIENLKYARTSQGIFCMGCHESLMARRRKRAKAAKAALNAGPPPVLDKSLPALPPKPTPHSDGGMRSASLERSPSSARRPKSRQSQEPGRRDIKDTSMLASSTYTKRRGSISSHNDSDSDGDDDEQRGYLPMTIDTNIVPGLSQNSATLSDSASQTPDRQGLSASRDYFVPRASTIIHRDMMRLSEPGSPRSPGTDGDSISNHTKSHVAFQEKGRSLQRTTSAANTPAESHTTSPSHIAAMDIMNRMHQNDASRDAFRLRDAPATRSRKNSAKSNQTPLFSRQEQLSPRTTAGPMLDTNAGLPESGRDSPDSGINPFDDPKLLDSVKVVHRREVPTSATSASSKPRLPEPSQSKHERSLSAVSGTGFSDGTQALPVHSQGRSPDSPLRSNLDAARSAGRSSAPSKSVANDDFIAPRQPPAPPAVRDARKASIASLPSDPTSPVRSHLSPSGLASEFNMDDEMSRIMRPDGRKESIAGESNSSVLRRVSNAMRHKRSHSDRVAGQTHRKTSSVGQVDIGGPYNTNVSMSPALSYMSKDDVALRAQLQTAQLRIADLEAEKQSLQEKLDSSASMTNFNSELREKRSTMAYLDTQREVAVRELETIATHLTRAKDTNQPFDIASLKNDVLHDLSQSLQRLKEQVSTHIEDLIHRRNELTDEITDLIQVKDKGLQEFESLSSKNNQLNDLNAQLAQSIQDSYKVTRTPANGTQVGLFNGLGINNGHRPSDASSFAIETRPHLASRGSNESPTSHMANHDTPELGEAQVLSAPQVVNIRKGQPKRFNWKKGSRDVAKNVTKGLKGAFAPRENEPTNGGLYHTSQPYQVGSLPSDSGSLKSSQISEPGKASATSMAFFQKSGLKQSSLGGAAKSTSTANLVTHEPSVLFGSELAARCEFENRLIPAVVTRCIQEVEARGMDVEGIYRKSGGTGQVQKIQAGFDRDPSGFDISDPDLDIHAVTSCLKQYFRKLPNPLITFEVYDSMLATDDIQDTERKCLALRAAVDSLPQAHRDVLELLIHHLVNVIAQQTTNLMTPLNISVVFAPTIMRPLTLEREMTDMLAQRETIRALLDHAAAVFD